MSDSEIVRDALGKLRNGVRHFAPVEETRQNALAALGALVAERDEYRDAWKNAPSKRAAIERAEAAESERDALRDAARNHIEQEHAWSNALIRSESRVAALEEALREIAAQKSTTDNFVCRKIARAALAGKEGT